MFNIYNKIILTIIGISLFTTLVLTSTLTQSIGQLEAIENLEIFSLYNEICGSPININKYNVQQYIDVLEIKKDNKAFIDYEAEFDDPISKEIRCLEFLPYYENTGDKSMLERIIEMQKPYMEQYGPSPNNTYNGTNLKNSTT